MTNRSAVLKAVIDTVRIALLDEHGAEALARFDTDVQRLVAPIAEVFATASDESRSEDDRGYAEALAGVAVMEAGRLLALRDE